MGHYKGNRIEKKGTHFIWEERLVLQRLLYKSKNKSPQDIADILGKSKRTVQREIKRGWESFIASDLSTYYAYSPDIAQRKCDENLEAKGPDLKLGNDYKLVEDISFMIREKYYSPDAVIMHYQKEGWPSKTRISVRTLYRYIDEGLIPDVTQDELLRKGKLKQKHGKRTKRHSRAASARKSITNRPVEVESREDPGHWEIDCVVSGKDKGTDALLTLTERSKRYQLIRKIKDQSSASVVKELDILERKYGSRRFRKIFKTITCDNGSEFMDTENMERSSLTKGKRTDVYYAHPYCSSERGSNENANGIIRRFIPKGTAIKDVKHSTVKWIQEWMNNYPRRILEGLSAKEAIQATMVI